MRWGYRIVRTRRGADGPDEYTIHEVSYLDDDALDIDVVRPQPAVPYGESRAGLQHDLRAMLEAFARPILEAKDYLDDR